MKKNFKFYLLSSMVFLLLLHTGCKKLIDAPYDNRLVLTNVQDYDAVLVAGYPVKHELFTEVMTDNYQFYASLGTATVTSFFLPYFKWSDGYLDNRFTGAPKAYAEYYAKIYTANLVIHGVLDSKRGTLAQKEALLGEALVLRAYCHFMLVNLFGLNYDKTTASTDLGVSIVTEISEKNTRDYLRSTVQETYDQIEKDLSAGIELLQKNSTVLSVNPYRFSLASAYAFYCREKLYKGEFEESAAYADKVIALKGRTVRDLAKDVAVIGRNGLDFFSIGYMDPSTHPNILLGMSTSNGISCVVATGYSFSGFYVNDTISGNVRSKSALYTAADLRRRLLQSKGTVIDACNEYVKYESQPNNPNTTSVRASLLTMEEVLLSRAEAVMRTSKNQQEALNDVNALRAARYTNYKAIAVGDYTDDELLKEILLERRKEFLNEGLRWFDIRRLNLGVDRTLERGGAVVDVLKPKDLRKAIQIPSLELRGNPNIQLNPR